jgi:SAM-dependent methyltransferase
LFDQVTALDPEPGMLQAGQRRCQQAGVANVRWLQGVADDIAALGLDPQRAVTFGQSFHRVRRLEVAEAVYDLLVPGGSLILISHNADNGRPRPAGPGHPEVPSAAVQKLILDYLGDSTRQYLATWNQGQPARFEDTLSQTRFGGSCTVYAPGRPDLIRDIDTVVASYFSLSYAAPRWFGTRWADFEADLRHLLREYAPDGLFWDWPGDTELVIATKS